MKDFSYVLSIIDLANHKTIYIFGATLKFYNEMR